MKKNTVLNSLYGCVSFLGGAALFGIAMNMFLSPGHVVMGGATGIATTINFLFPKIPIGIMIMAINVPLLLLNTRYVGSGAILKTVGGIAVSSVMIDVLTFLPVTIEDPLLCAVLGGVTMGSGAGMMLSRGFTTGGSDLAALMLKRRFKMLTTGRIILIIDAAVVLGAAFIMKRYEGILYSAVASFAYSAAVDAVMGGAERAKIAYIVSEKYEDIAAQITEQLHRGVTVLDGNGWYTKEEKKVLMCVVKRHEEYSIKTIVEKTDPTSFMVLSDATEVVGEGFKSSADAERDMAKIRAEKRSKRKKRREEKREKRRAEKAEIRELKAKRRAEKKRRSVKGKGGKNDV